MSLFKCKKCSCIENTALVTKWWDEPLCSECRTGKWHNKFKKSTDTNTIEYCETCRFIKKFCKCTKSSILYINNKYASKNIKGGE